MNVHGSLGRSDCWAMTRADQHHVLVNVGILHDAEPLANLDADVFAELPFLLFGERQVVDLLFHSCPAGLLQGAAEAPELRMDRARKGEQHHHDD